MIYPIQTSRKQKNATESKYGAYRRTIYQTLTFIYGDFIMIKLHSIVAKNQSIEAFEHVLVQNGQMRSTDGNLHLITTSDIPDGTYKVIKEGIIPSEYETDLFQPVPEPQGEMLCTFTFEITKKELNLFQKSWNTEQSRYSVYKSIGIQKQEGEMVLISTDGQRAALKFIEDYRTTRKEFRVHFDADKIVPMLKLLPSPVKITITVHYDGNRWYYFKIITDDVTIVLRHECYKYPDVFYAIPKPIKYVLFDRKSFTKVLQGFKKKYGFKIDDNDLRLSITSHKVDLVMYTDKVNIIDSADITGIIYNVNIQGYREIVEERPTMVLLMPVTLPNIASTFKLTYDIITNLEQDTIDWYIADEDITEGCKKPYIIC